MTLSNVNLAGGGMGKLLDNKIAIITGGASGIGRATAKLFVDEGARVLIADVNRAGQELADSLGANAIFCHTDMGQRDQIAAMVDRAVDHFGGLDILFNNAGVSCAAFPQFVDDTLEDFERVMAINVLGPMFATRNAARIMMARGGGVILNNSSIAGTLAGQAMMTYRASKAALIQFSKSSAIDLAKHGIRVNCIVPGHIRTPLSAFGEAGVSPELAARIEAGVGAAYLSNQLIKRRGEPEDCAEAALFLASDKAKHITGIVLPVEAGVTAGDPVNHLQDILDARAAALAGENG